MMGKGKNRRYSFGCSGSMAEETIPRIEGDALAAVRYTEGLCLEAYTVLGPLCMSLAVGSSLSPSDAAYLEQRLPEKLEAAASMLRRARFATGSRPRMI